VPSAHPPRRLRLTAPAAWHDGLAQALAAAGVVLDATANAGLAVTPARSVPPELDAWTVDSSPHLLVAVWPYGVEVGPWVLPGVGPCARCVAAATLDDTGRGLPPGHSPDPALLAMAAGWAARDLAAWQAAGTPTTWLTSWLLGPDPAPVARRWERHPYCGCAWWEPA
jgi:hypothetical protein